MSKKNICDCSGDCGCPSEEAAARGSQKKSTPLSGTAMDTQIFKLGLGVLPTSVYIIIAALQSDGAKPSLSAIAGRWNEKPAALNLALEELQALNIISRHLDSGAEAIYLTNPAAMWAPNNIE